MQLFKMAAPGKFESQRLCHDVRTERMTEGQIFSCPARPKLSQLAFYHMPWALYTIQEHSEDEVRTK